MIAVLGDIHGNLWALEAVLAEVDRLRPQQVVVTGDLALGGPRPAECVTAIRRRGYPTVRGNTDEWLTTAPTQVHDHLSWTSQQLGEENRRYLAGLPFLWRHSYDSGDLVVVHATPWSVGDVVPPDAPDSLAQRVFVEARATAVVYGHIHWGYVREIGTGLLVNAGSVGSPYDGDPRASYAILDSREAKWKATLQRVPYDVDQAVRAARALETPQATLWARQVETATRLK